jgi:hypothetical protein
MANWAGSARTNYFKVKDPEAFKAEMAKYELEVWPSEPDSSGCDPREGSFALGSHDEWGGWPSSVWDEAADEDVEIDLTTLVSKHLAVGEVAIFMEIGAEKLRYLTGQAIAINAKGEHRTVNLDDIYRLAAELGPNVTQATY